MLPIKYLIFFFFYNFFQNLIYYVNSRAFLKARTLCPYPEFFPEEAVVQNKETYKQGFCEYIC